MKASEAKQQIIELFDRLVHPKRMDREEYKDLMAELIEDLQARLDTAEEEDEAEE